MQGPLFRFLWGAFSWVLELLADVVRKFSCGRLSSLCRPPRGLRAQAVGRSEVVLRWVADLPGNIFHEENYECGWRVEASGSSSPSGTGTSEKRILWKRRPLDELYCDDQHKPVFGGGGGCRECVALLDGLPEGARLRIRVRSINCFGPSDWAKEEIEVDTASLGKGPGACGPTKGRSRVVARTGADLCLRCRESRPAGKTPAAYAEVACRPLFGGGCHHGPFCARCCDAMGAQVVPSCVCRALIGSWRDTPPPPLSNGCS